MGIAAVVSSALAQDAPRAPEAGLSGSVTVHEAIRLALENNRSLQIGFLGRRSNRLQLRVVENDFDWQLSVSGSTDATRAVARSDGELQSRTAALNGDVSTTVLRRMPLGTLLTTTLNSRASRSFDELDGISGAPDYLQSVGVGVSQPLLRGAGRRIAFAPVSQARLGDRISHLALRAQVIVLVGQVISAYNALALAERQREIAASALQRSRDQRETNRLLIQVGRLARDDIVQSDAEVSLREASLNQADNQVASAKLALLGLLGMGGTDIEIAEDLDAEPIQLDTPAAIGIARESEPGFRIASLSLQVAELTRDVALDSRRWALDLRAGANLLNRRPNFGDSTRHLDQADLLDYQVGLNLNIPIGDVSREVAAEQARIAYEQARLSLAESEQQLVIAVTGAVRDAQAAWRQVRLAEQSVKLATRQVEVERRKLQLGRTSSFNVIQLEDALVRAENDEVGARVAYLGALVQLDSSMGTTLDTWGIRVTDQSAQIGDGIRP